MGVGWRWAWAAAVALVGCGQVPDHGAGLALEGAACFSCHGDRYLATTAPDHAAQGFPTACETCHGTEAWRPASAGSHDFWPLTGAHATVVCASCHADGYQGTPTACEGCHLPEYQATVAPDHVAGGLPTACGGCHTTIAWRPAGFDAHDQFWPLEGKHATAECTACHVGEVYAGTPRACVGCHQTDYDGTVDPPHAASHFPTACETCHTAAGWTPASFAHDPFWPLRGKHIAAACTACHVNDVYAGTPRACVGCHQADYAGATAPPHAAAQLPTTCETCHSETGWTPAAYDHAQYWPLEGQHATTPCASCHVNGQYAGTPTGCVFCHEADYQQSTSPSHLQLNLPQTCQTCHTPASWATDTFPGHDPLFPITSGKHRNISCSECHGASGDYAVFSCTGCHEHRLSEMNQEHQGEVADYQATLNQYGVEGGCYHCHPDGREPND